MRNSLNSIIEELKKGALVLTVNSRLSRYLTSQYDLARKAEGLKLWQSPRVTPLTAWFERMWDELGPALSQKPLLDALRSKALWESVVEKDLAAALPGDIARISYEAYSIMKEYRIEMPEALYLTEEAKALKGWISVYEKELDKLGFTDTLVWPEILVNALCAGGADVQGPVIFAGFDELTPRARSLISGLKKRGAGVSFWPDPPDSPDPIGEGGKGAGGARDKVPVSIEAPLTVRPYNDELEEVTQAARWARRIYRPGTRIGVIVPEIERYRGLIKREFGAELDPASVLDPHGGKDVFNISLGSPLSEEPVIRAALDILSISEGPEGLDKVISALLSPFLSIDTDLSLSALDFRLRKENTIKISLFDLRKHLPLRSRANAVIGVWLEEMKETRGKALPGAWAEKFSRFLKRLGFPAVKLSSREFQAQKAWTDLLQAFSHFSSVFGRITRGEAARRLTRLAKGTLHQPETPETGVQVMGVLEAAGQVFDHVWIMGCHEYAFPASPRPNPFIPLYLQKKLNLPRSSSEKELDYAARALRRILKSADSFEVSYPRTSEDRELNVSPFFRMISPAPADDIYIMGSSRVKDALNREGRLEEAPEDPYIPVTEEELKNLKGGTGVIKNQSLCPFRAFATHRLNARAVPVPEFGLPAAKRGDLIHEALKSFWQEVGGLGGLKALKESGELSSRVSMVAEKVLSEAVLPPPLSTGFIGIEKERLTNVLNGWLDVEMERTDFTVTGIELKKEVTIKGLRITGKPDRIDTLKDGRAVIIDYKTGNNADRNDWLSSRPRDPQLLIYTLNGRFDAIAFASLKPGECRFIGTGRSSDILPGVKAFEDDTKWRERFGEGIGWEGLMDFWKNAIEALAEEFMAGVARVDPSGEKDRLACNTCDLKMLCRITEARAFPVDIVDAQ